MSNPAPARQTILFSGHDLRFIRPFVAYCEASPRYRVLFDRHDGHEIRNEQKCRALLPAADLIFCEWCLSNAVWYSRHKSPHQVVVVRLHLQELQLPYLDRVDWENVDALVLICPRNQDLIRERYPFLKGKTHLIYNPIDSAAFDQPKLPGAEFNLGMMGICPMRKAPHLAWALFTQLRKMDSRYTLFVKGRHPRDYDWLWRRPEERAYYEEFYRKLERSSEANSAVLETYGEDVPLWFSKIGFVLSTSDFEGSHQSIAEGMASGAIPIIRNWAGADRIYPPKYVFSTIEEAAAAVLKWRKPGVYAEEMQFCREYARGHFDQGGICGKLEALLDSLGRRTPASQAKAAHPPRGRASVPPVMILGYLPVGFRGGYRIRIEQEIRTLANHGCDVHLACLHPGNGEPAALEAHRAELEALGCRVHLVSLARFFDIHLEAAAIKGALDTLQAIAEANGLLVLHAEALYCARLGLLLKERCPAIRLVFDCHGAGPEEERMGGAHAARISAMEQWEQRVLREADLNVFVSEAMHEFYRERGRVGPLPRLLLPCCVADERFAGDRADEPPPGLPARRPIIAYLGTLAAWQCGEEMIRLFAQILRHDPQIFFLLLVPQRDHARARQWMRQYHLPEESVRLLELPHDQVVSTLRHAHAGVLLRRAHPVNRVSSPTKFGEYLAAGLPVILTEGIGDFSRMAAQDGLGLVLNPVLLDLDEFPAAEISRIAEFVRESQKRRRQVAARCRRAARRRLHWKTATAALIRAYRDILRNHPKMVPAEHGTQGSKSA